MKLVQSLVTETAEKILADGRTATAGLSWPKAFLQIWEQLDESGFPMAGVPEANGGFGLEPFEIFELFRLSGVYPEIAPVGDTIHSNWILAKAEMEIPFGQKTFRLLSSQPTNLNCGLNHTCAVVTVLADQGGGSRVSISDTRETVGEFIPCNIPFDHLLQVSALVRSAQMAGSMLGATETAIDYSCERQQFGRPLAKFQAIQHMIAQIAGEVSLGFVAVQSAVSALADPDTAPETLCAEIASAKIQTSRSAGMVARNAHQILGAMGYTEEHILCLFTRHLWQWRDDCGSEFYWSDRVASNALAEKGRIWEKVVK